MTQKDYVKLAAMFAKLAKTEQDIDCSEYKYKSVLRIVVDAFCDLAKADNPNFKSEKFRTACNLA